MTTPKENANRHSSCLILAMSKVDKIPPREWLMEKLRQNGNSFVKTADRLGLTDETLHRGVRRYDLQDVVVFDKRPRRSTSRARLPLLKALGYREDQGRELLQSWADRGYSEHLTAERLGMSHATLRRWARDEKVTFPKRSRSSNHKERLPGKPSPERAEKLSRKVTWREETQTLAEWARRTGLTRMALAYRIKHWGLERAMTTPRDYSHGGRRGHHPGTLTGENP